MIKPWRHGLALLGGLFLSLSALAADSPAAVRIAIVAFTQGGAPVFGGIPVRVFV